MKIRRIRRGFTTNSSASTEWVPPPSQSNGSQGITQSPGAPGAGSGNPASPGTTNLASNSLAIGGVLIGLASLFLVERLIKRLRKRRNADGDVDGDVEGNADE